MGGAGEVVSEQVTTALARAQARGWVGRGPLDRQIAHARAFGRVLVDHLGEPPTDLVDLGSGGGLPALVLAHDWPHCRLTLVERTRQRADGLDRAVVACGWTARVRVVCADAIEFARDPDERGKAPAITVRSVAPAVVVAEMVGPLLSPTGVCVVSDVDAAPARWEEVDTDTLGLTPPVQRREGEWPFVVFQRSGACDDRVPRRGVVRRAQAR